MDRELKWIRLTPENCDFYGVDEHYERMPREEAMRVSAKVAGLAVHSAGGRIRFSTDSSVITMRAQILDSKGIGFDLYQCVDQPYPQELFETGFRRPECFVANGLFEPTNVRDFTEISAFNPEEETWENRETQTEEARKLRYFTLNLPYNTKIEEMWIGLDPDASFGHGMPYRNEKPVLFYGSSITTGGWASRAGLTYEALISQKWNLNYRNYGFSGGAKGEPYLASYLAGQEMSAFVLDYDHNADSAEMLAQTHEAFYQVIRAAHPDIPILIITAPDFFANPIPRAKREKVIYQTYLHAKERGENVYFISGRTLFGGDYYTNCTKDRCHPNDLGFYRMASVIGPVVAEMLGYENPSYDESFAH